MSRYETEKHDASNKKINISTTNKDIYSRAADLYSDIMPDVTNYLNQLVVIGVGVATHVAALYVHNLIIAKFCIPPSGVAVGAALVVSGVAASSVVYNQGSVVYNLPPDSPIFKEQALAGEDTKNSDGTVYHHT